jgi:cation:H+ antiporter
LADLLYRKANLEFAAASVENLMMSVQLMLLFSILLIAFNLPDITLFSINPASLLLIVTYLFTIKLLVDTHEKPMWLPRMTPGTVRESARHPGDGRPRLAGTRLFIYFAVCAGAVALSGWIMATSGMVIAQKTGLSAGIMGGIFIAVATSLPELVVAVTAIRMGALTLAVGDIVGGNAFDTLFIAVSDFFYRDGSIYAAIAHTEKIWLGSAMLMNSVLLMGLMYRERKGIANIGMESVLIAVIYLITIIYLGL